MGEACNQVVSMLLVAVDSEYLGDVELAALLQEICAVSATLRQQRTTPLHLASHYTNLPVAKLLLSSGAPADW